MKTALEVPNIVCPSSTVHTKIALSMLSATPSVPKWLSLFPYIFVPKMIVPLPKSVCPKMDIPFLCDLLNDIKKTFNTKLDIRGSKSNIFESHSHHQEDFNHYNLLEVSLTSIPGDHETLSIVRHVELHIDFPSMKSSLGLHLRVWSELGRSPPFRRMRALKLDCKWSRAFSLVCEVALTSRLLISTDYLCHKNLPRTVVSNPGRCKFGCSQSGKLEVLQIGLSRFELGRDPVCFWKKQKQTQQHNLIKEWACMQGRTALTTNIGVPILPSICSWNTGIWMKMKRLREGMKDPRESLTPACLPSILVTHTGWMDRWIDEWMNECKRTNEWWAIWAFINML